MVTADEVQAELNALKLEVAVFKADVDMWYLVVMGALVFFMQSGFALLEAGSVRAKNTKNILMKNLLDACIGALVFWAFGYSLAYDGQENGFIGTFDAEHSPSAFMWAYNEEAQASAYSKWWFQYVFCAAAATIVSGAMAERTTLVGYLTYTIVISALIYPVVVHWGWNTGAGDGTGWVDKFTTNGLLDFGGSAVVHMTGGVSALVGAAIVGPRKGRFDEKKKPLPMPAHNTTFQVLGTFILWVGWYGFNPGSTLQLNGKGVTMSRAVITTTLSAATGGLTCLFMDKLFGSHTWDIGQLCNGILGGLVAITAGCAAVYPYAAVVIGVCAALFYRAASYSVLNLCKVDDPLDAFAVHGTCGFWGVIAASLFAIQGFTEAGHGLFEGGDGSADYLYTAMIFCVTDWVWTGSLSVLMFLPLKLLGLLRVSAQVESAGMDVSKHGGSAYYHQTGSDLSVSTKHGGTRANPPDVTDGFAQVTPGAQVVPAP